ncbi:MAG: VCBS repeat-containing protein, partial [Proteobacteria bacterium]|nr:VCBS repeat-containing protein [Pseudomonadota bacterium]
AVDLDGDGKLDVLVANSSIGIGWFRGLGGGSFAGFQLLASDMSLPVRVVTMDVDGIGGPDVLCLSAWDSTLAWYPNTGGVLGARQIIEPATSQAQELFLRDVDGDGDLDLLLEDAGATALGWYANLGAGVFGPQQQVLPATAGYVDIATSDLDGDGDLDVVRSSGLPWDSGVSTFENLGASGWAPAVVHMDGFLGELILDVGDLDGDLDPDLVACSTGNGRLVWLSNLGAGTFGAMQDIDALQGGSFDDLVVTDLSGDGKPDLLVASATDDRVMWYRNLGGGSFDVPVKLAWGFMAIDNPYSVAAVDFDGDGDEDVLAASQYGYPLAWFENLGSG